MSNLNLEEYSLPKALRREVDSFLQGKVENYTVKIKEDNQVCTVRFDYLSENKIPSYRIFAYFKTDHV